MSKLSISFNYVYFASFPLLESAFDSFSIASFTWHVIRKPFLHKDTHTHTHRIWIMKVDTFIFCVYISLLFSATLKLLFASSAKMCPAKQTSLLMPLNIPTRSFGHRVWLLGYRSKHQIYSFEPKHFTSAFLLSRGHWACLFRFVVAPSIFCATFENLLQIAEPHYTTREWWINIEWTYVEYTK